ncbi:MAG: hypothetical protein HY077_09345 [Elusimicrobia bacterium]|nr:hypothetical protein [Elusimicrobiota bacterium]
MRLRKLRFFGLIRPQRVYTEARQVYLLERGGYTYLEKMGRSLELGYLPEIDLRVFEHDKAVTDLRLALEEAGAEAWRSERELRRDRPGHRVPDAIFTKAGVTVALEFENADKGAERYRAIFLDHLERPSADHILYVVRPVDKLKTLRPLLESVATRRLGLDLGRISFAWEPNVLAQRFGAMTLNVVHGDLPLVDILSRGRRTLV